MPRRLAAPASGHPRAAAVRPRREHAHARHAWLTSTHLLPIRVDHAARALTPSTGLTNEDASASSGDCDWSTRHLEVGERESAVAASRGRVVWQRRVL